MALTPLSKLDDYKLVDEKQDVRGWPVQDAAGAQLGKVEDLIVDTEERRVSTLRLDAGIWVPVKDVTLGDGVVVFEGEGAGAAPGRAAGTEDEVRLPVLEEQLQVSKREVERGAVRVSTVVSERPVEEQVRLREEHVSVERRPVDRPVAPAAVAALRDQTLEVRESAEVPVVAKEARVVEEVVVRKDVAERAETVRDTLRRTDIRVEALPPGQRDPRRG
jgi:uncharacterized protein (TIGR02271 family)